MEAINTARRNEPWRKEFMHARELRECGRKEGYEDGLAEGIGRGLEQGRAEAQAQIAELEKRLAKYETI